MHQRPKYQYLYFSLALEFNFMVFFLWLSLIIHQILQTWEFQKNFLTQLWLGSQSVKQSVFKFLHEPSLWWQAVFKVFWSVTFHSFFVIRCKITHCFFQNLLFTRYKVSLRNNCQICLLIVAKLYLLLLAKFIRPLLQKFLIEKNHLLLVTKFTLFSLQ